MVDDNPFEFSQVDRRHLPPQPDIDTSELLEFADSLDKATDGCDTVSQLAFAEDGRHGFRLIANRSALLRLSALMLRLACKNPQEATQQSLVEPVTHEQIMIGATDSMIADIRHTATFPDPIVVQHREERRWWMRDRLFLIGCGIVGFVLMGLLLSGLAFWSMIFSGQIQ